jgi:tRNA(fMet)-specific endonuclease VapC
MSIRYLLDTNICIYIAKHNPAAVRARFERTPAASLAMSVVTWGELCFGAEKSQHSKATYEKLEALRESIQIVALADEVAFHCGQIRQALARIGQPIGNNDLWIAAHARANAWTLVTHNTSEFLRVERLKVEDWVTPISPTSKGRKRPAAQHKGKQSATGFPK